MAAGRVLVAEDVAPCLVEAPQQGRGDLLDEGSDRGLAGLGDNPAVTGGQALDEHLAVMGVDDRGQRRVLPRLAMRTRVIGPVRASIACFSGSGSFSHEMRCSTVVF